MIKLTERERWGNPAKKKMFFKTPTLSREEMSSPSNLSRRTAILPLFVVFKTRFDATRFVEYIYIYIVTDRAICLFVVRLGMALTAVYV